MNCQDITRLVDSVTFSVLTDSERRDAEAHALSCQHCAPLWIMHASVAATRVPATPAELSVRCLTLAAAATKPGASPRRVSRVMVAVGSVVVLAAAASMLLVNVANAPAPQRDPVASLSPVTTAVPSPPPQEAPVPAAEPAVQTASQEPPPAALQRAVQLFPPPLDAEKAFIARQKMALEKLVELYPALTQPPAAETMFVAAITLREDGTVLDHAMRAATRETWRQVDEELQARMPVDGGETLGDYAPKGTALADGRTLGANLRFRHLTVRNTYDPARSSVRVEEIMRAQRAELMMPVTEVGGSHVAVLLSRDGAILREVAGYMGRDELQQRNDWSPAQRAEDMARRLGVSKDEIGLMGSKPVFDNETRRAVFVDYAWKRLPGESGAEYKQGGGKAFEAGVDLVAAVALVERVMPDAFMGADVERALGMPAILLNEQGEFIRTGRVKLGTDPVKPLRDAFPGVSIGSLNTVVLSNGKGATSAVTFIWQGKPGPK